MKLVWSARALEDRRGIFDHIEADDPRAAVMVDERIQAASWRLLDYPQSGRPGRVEGTRELVIARTPYIAPFPHRLRSRASVAFTSAESDTSSPKVTLPPRQVDTFAPKVTLFARKVTLFRVNPGVTVTGVNPPSPCA